MRQTKTLRVLPNPWPHIHIYADGVPRPCCTVQCDMVEHAPTPGRLVGARVDHAVETRKSDTLRIGKATVTRAHARHDTYYSFATEPAEIPNTGYYRDRLRERSLIAADAETAKAAGLPFVEPAKALATERDRAIANFDATYGAGAWAESQPQPEPLPEASAGSAAVPKPQTAQTTRSKDR